MGLLDGLTGMLGGGNSGVASAAGPLLNMLIGDKGQEGGLGNIIAQLQQSGLADQVGSWLGGGDNSAVSADQIQGALGGDTLSKLGGALGIGEGDVAGQLSALLPSLVDKLSPNGEMNVADTDASEVLGALGNLFGK